MKTHYAFTPAQIQARTKLNIINQVKASAEDVKEDWIVTICERARVAIICDGAKAVNINDWKQIMEVYEEVVLPQIEA